jgi:transposase
MAGRVRVREITSEEGNRLLRIVRRSSGSVVTWRRAQMVLLSAQGMDVSKIASVAFTSPDRVREVIHNFNDDGLDSLYPKYAGGRPLTFTLPQRREIRKVALSRPMDHGLPFSVWSLTKLADFLVAEGVVDDISHEGLRVLLREEGVSFQVIKTWKQSTDPDFEAKKNRVLELYDIAEGTTDPQDGDPEVVLCMDEFGPLNLLPRPGKQWAPQASKTTKGSRKDPRRRRRRATYTKTLGVRHLFAAYDLGTDKIYGHIKPNKKRGTFLVFCRYLRTLYPPEVRIGIVLDNFSPHLSTRVDTRVGDWAEANNVEFSYVPTNASWLNRIEAQFQALRYFTLDGTDHRTHEEQNSMIRRYIKWRNTNAHDETGSPWVTWRLSSVECSSLPVETHPRHHRVLIGGEPTSTWTASMHLRLPIRVLSASRKTHITFPSRAKTLGTGAVA